MFQVEGAADENMIESLDVMEGEKEGVTVDSTEPQTVEDCESINKPEKSEERKDYNLDVLKHVQVIFAHLACSKLQYYVPRGFWKHFRLCGEAVNLREQHDAVEFFNSVVDSIDESLKTLSYNPIFSKVMGGSFADQKICKGCPHRYVQHKHGIFLTYLIAIGIQGTSLLACIMIIIINIVPTVDHFIIVVISSEH